MEARDELGEEWERSETGLYSVANIIQPVCRGSGSKDKNECRSGEAELCVTVSRQCCELE